MAQIRPGDTVIVDGVEYLFDGGAAEAYNQCWLIVQKGLLSEKVEELSLRRAHDGSPGWLVPFQKIQEALE